jgi:XTP/dITP diphosphohydrolase
MFQILAATANQGKLREFRSLLGDAVSDVEILGPDDIGGIPIALETGQTFEENAQIKAVSASVASGMVAFADDSGLVVEALGGAPGIHSARYAGADATDAQRIAKLLDELGDNPNRSAKFVCVIAIASGETVIGTFCGEVRGVIAQAPRGNGGFGYDPVFIPEGFDRTFGEIEAAVKDQISHRARAIRKVLEFCEDMNLTFP